MDYNRVQLLIAVMEKRASLSLGEYDIYLNVTGGMRVQEPALDLAAVVAIASAYLDIPLDEKSLAFGEIGLAGEIRGVSAAALRVRDAVKLGYEKIMLPAASARAVEEKYRKYCIPVRTVREAVDRLRG